MLNGLGMECKREEEDVFLKDIVIKQEKETNLIKKHGNYFVEIPGAFRDVIVKEEYCVQEEEEEKETCTKEREETFHEKSPKNLKNSTIPKQREKKKHECEVCGKIFERRTTLKRHSLVHSGEKRFECGHCARRFSLKQPLKRHLLNHLETHPLPCDVCKKLLKNRDTLKTHISRQHGGTKMAALERRHECGVCRRRFFKKYHMQRHILTIHEGRREAWRVDQNDNAPYVCGLCGKEFLDKYIFTRHSLVHTDQRSFPCSVCHKSFKQKYHLDIHRLIHTGQKPFTCAICRQSFSQKGNMKIHMEKHLGTEGTKCPVCGKSVTAPYLKSHMKRRHGKELCEPLKRIDPRTKLY